MLKLIYLAKRKPGFSHDQFVRRWRMHGALGMQQSIWRHALGYVQSEPIRPSPVPGASEEYDAVACLMVGDAMFSDRTEQDAEAGQRMAADELETFAVPIPTVSLWVTEEQLRPGDLGGISAYLFFSSEAQAKATANLAVGVDTFTRIVLNQRDDSLFDGALNTLPYLAVLELSAAGITSLSAAMAALAGKPQAPAELTVVTRDAVLWDRIPPRAGASE